jgi:hypothetical protein
MKKLGLIGLLAIAACSSPTAPGGIKLMGVWGSDQGHFTANQVSTQFTGPCGSGNTSRPLILDRHGKFDMTGTYGRSALTFQSARFIGAVGSGTLTLRVVMGDSSVAVAPIVMRLGQQPALATCH